MFKLGMENGFKSFANQYSINIAALNKLQRNEERDKKRHLSHKFSLTQASEFKWLGSLYGKWFFMPIFIRLLVYRKSLLFLGVTFMKKSVNSITVMHEVEALWEK
jgi:hypothetical protein